MEPFYTRLFHPHLLGVKDQTLHVPPKRVTSYCALSGLTFTTWFDDYRNAFIDPTCIVVHIASSLSTSSYSSSSAAGSSPQGTHASNSTVHATTSTSYGTYYGPLSPHNTAGMVPAFMPQSKPHADLYAAGMSLLHLHRVALLSPCNRTPSVRNVVLITDSAYLVSCLTQNVVAWGLKGYKNSKGKEVANASAVKWVERLVVGLEKNGVGVRFWKVDKKENHEAVRVAKRVFVQEGSRKHVIVHLENLVPISPPKRNAPSQTKAKTPVFVGIVQLILQ